jgi:photosystem II stability/assembly factor-like uncharacterized protein
MQLEVLNLELTSPEILKTTDGGTNWVEQTVAIDSGLRAIHCTDADHCIACGYAGRIIKTSDGGATWSVFSGGTTQTFEVELNLQVQQPVLSVVVQEPY